jgi:hypothetical protein
MAVVYRAIDESTGQRIALKRLREQRSDEENAALFEREYHTLRRLRHPTIVEVYDYGVDDGAPYYTMELLEGQNLYELAPLGYREACRHLRDVASSLALLHARRLVHRDVSARNVVRNSAGRCKLVDFGGLAPFGVSLHVLGTPPFTAPEVLSGVPLDQRVDLYALGALGYWLLTKKHAFSARRFADLVQLSRVRPAPPSALVPEVPAALDELLLSLLSDKPLARPSSAAEVIDRLTRIAELEREESLGVAQGYLASPALSGRSVEMHQLRSALAQAQRGRGGLVVVEGASGMGKTRLLTELVIEAQIAGAIVVQVDGSMHRDSFGVATALALRLLDVAPEEAQGAAQPYGGYLARLSPALLMRLDATERRSQVEGPEWRGRVQEALQGWLLAVSAHRTVVLAVDEAGYADTSSLAMLAALGLEARKSKVLVVATVSGSAASAAPQLSRSHNQLIRLRPLASVDTAELVRSLFGDVPNLARLSEWLHDTSSGNPLCSVELARKLVSDQFVRYVEGTWMVPQETPRQPLPRNVQDAARSRLGELGADALGLARSLSLWRGPIPVAICLMLASDTHLSNPFEALEELVSTGVLLGHGDDYRFAQDSLRQELVESLDPERRARLHRRIGEWLLERRTHDPAARIEAGWHLLHGGEERRGADLLARQAVTLRDLNFFEGDVRGTTAAIEAALSVYKKEKRSAYELIPLLFALTLLGYFFERRLAETYGDEAVDVLERAAGLGLARRLERLLGARLSVVIGLALAWLVFVVRRPRRLAYGFDLLVTYFVGSVTSLCAVATVCLDPARGTRMAARLEPFAALGPRRTTAAIHRYCVLLAGTPTERFTDVRKGWLELDRVFDDPKQVTLLSDEARRTFRGGILYALGVHECFRGRSTALEYAERLAALGVKNYEMVADQVRATHHAFRGEMPMAERWRERVELHGIQLGSSWQADLWWPVCKLHVDMIVGDVVGLKNASELLDGQIEAVPTLARYSELARTAHAFWHGDPRAVEMAARIEEFEPASFMGWIAACGMAAAIYNQAGQHERARKLSEQALAHFGPIAHDYLALTVASEVELPLARAGLGDVDGAVHDFERLLERCSIVTNPLVNAWVHRGRARLALMTGDSAVFEQHLAEMRRWSEASRHPMLIAHCEALAAQASGGASSGKIEAAGVSTPGSEKSEAEVTARALISERTDAETATLDHDPSNVVTLRR